MEDKLRSILRLAYWAISIERSTKIIDMFDEGVDYTLIRIKGGFDVYILGCSNGKENLTYFGRLMRHSLRWQVSAVNNNGNLEDLGIWNS